MPQPVKQPININFQQGLNLKADPYQVPVGNFLKLVNTIFDKVGRLSKRNGYGFLSTLPDNTTSYLTTLNGNLQAIGTNLLAYSGGQAKWAFKGSTYPLQVSSLPLVRNAVAQIQGDATVAPNGLVCTAYLETNGVVPDFKYVIADGTTGQNIVSPVTIPADSTYGAPRVFVLGNYFLILYTAQPSGFSLNYIAIPWGNNNATPITGQITPSYAPATTQAFDGVVYNNSLYIVFNGATASGMQVTSLSSTLVQSSISPLDAAHQGTIVSVCADEGNGVLWATYYDSVSTAGYTTAFLPSLITTLPPQQFSTTLTILNIATSAQNNLNSIFYEVENSYSYDPSIPSNYIRRIDCTIGGALGASIISVRSVGLASKSFIIDGIIYYLAAYDSPFQPTYFLMNGSTSIETNPIIVAKLAYSNGGGYDTLGLPSVYVDGSTARIAYLRKDLLEAQAPAAAQSINLSAPNVYSQTGINLATFAFNTNGLIAVDIGGNLNLSGGFLWDYDGYNIVENNFMVWPDSVEAAGSTTPGAMTAQKYYYQVTYEWTDNQGNLYRSAPSIPVAVTLTGDTSVDISIPTLRLTYKTASPVRIVIYRWSVANPVYFQVTSISTPPQNDLTADDYTYNDGLADTAIVGNNIIYTTGGVIEDTGAPASNILALFDDRLWLVDAEDPNLLWYSKQVIEGTPVEMSDLFTLFVAPSTAAEGSTGNITALYPMDDKLIIFKGNAIYYINGSGPDNTGNNSTYSQPIFITSTVGCMNPRSIAMAPNGLMFQSNKGIWLLGRDLSTKYIGAEVEDFNSFTVTSAIAAPATNQIRFALSNGSSLMYDYYVNQWGEFQGSPSISSCLYQNLQTTVDVFGRVYQETPGVYLDGARPVLMSFTTSWLNIAGLRGYIRAYWFFLLGTYLSPHKLSLSIAYDYNSSPIQSNLIAPINHGFLYGEDPFYGSESPYGGPTNIEQWRIFLERQRCKAFSISMQEVFDPSFGTVAGPGLTLSGLNCIVGLKRGWAPIPQNQSVG